MAREGRFQFGRDAGAQPHRAFHAELHQEGREQEAADAPGEAVAAVEFGRPEIERAVDIDLLEGRGAVAAIFGGGCGWPPLPLRGGSCSTSLPPPIASKASVAPVSAIASVSFDRGSPRRCCRRCISRRSRAGSRPAPGCGPRSPGDAVGDADTVEHLAEVRGGGGVDQRLVALGTAQRLDHR
jgi:hypothetical protein